ncbi:MAG TPA: hypothetical protein VFC42_08565 [Methylomirabilota bacterium]|nr:hypothetical protein [Methylomirabilota bacterium]
MHPIQPCQSYQARPAGRAVYANGPHRFKVYYVDIPGRSRPELYEWDQAGRDRETVLAGLKRAGVEGVGFVCAFPHVAKVFRFGPENETVLNVRAFRPADFGDLDLGRADGYVECACLAEAVLLEAEYRLWAAAPTVEDYLHRWVDWPPVAIGDRAKLARYYGTGGA